MGASQSTKSGFEAFPELTVRSDEAPQLRLVDADAPRSAPERAEITQGFITTPTHAFGTVELRLTDTQLFITIEPRELTALLPPRALDEEIVRASEEFLRAKGRDPAHTEIILVIKSPLSGEQGSWPTDW